ncbi:hypothetical protein [Nocardioides sp.]|uniref:hypothetical protein n=1 Tax=Nocardioides sp. TaxID=35761 RepID=UPI003783DF82
MEKRVDPWLLWPRALFAGGLAFGFGVVGHVTADGLLPGRWLLLALLGMSVILSASVLNRPAGRVRLVALLVSGQTAIHLALTVTAGHRGDPGLGTTSTPPLAPATGPRALPVVDGHRVGSLQDAYQGMSGHATGSAAVTLPVGHLINDMSAHAPMMAAHLLAAALVGLWLAHGERCLWELLALTGSRVLAATWALAPVPVATTVAAPAPVARAFVPVALRQSRPAARRGPPALAA